MSNSIIISRSKHLSLLADHRTDPITKKLLEVGDEVCVCAKCKTVYLKDVWVNTKRNNCCDQSLTLKEIPNATIIDFKKEKRSSKVSKKSYKGIFVFFFLTTIVACVACYYLYTEHKKAQGRYSIYYEQQQQQKQQQQQQDEFAATHYDKNKLDSTITSLTNYISVLKGEKIELERRLKISSQGLKRSVIEVETKSDVLSSDIYIAGIKYEEIENYSIDYSKDKSKIRFTVHQPIYLKSVKIEAASEGFMTAFIYNTKGKLICQVYNGSIKDGLGTLNFNYMINRGEYYITHEGNVNLTFISDFNNYPISDNVISIKGPKNKNEHYMNFFEWTYQVVIK